LPDALLPALAALPDVSFAEPVFLAAVLSAGVALAVLAELPLGASAVLDGVGCFVLLGIVDLRPLVEA